MLSVRNLTKTFYLHTLGGATIRGCRDVSFDLDAGTFLALTGPSGSGKSSVLKCIYRTYLPTRGEIWFSPGEGPPVDLARANDAGVLRFRRQDIGYVTQFLRVVPRVSVVDVVAEGLWNIGTDMQVARRAAEEMLGALLIRRELFGVSPVTFSGGEQQRVNLARALVLRPRLLLLDEPIASLDPAAGTIVIDYLRDLKARGTTIIGIFHNLDVVRDAVDVVLRMQDGIGSTSTVMGRA